MASAGAAPATGNHLYFRLTAVNTAGAGTAYRAYPKLQAGVPRPVSPKSSGTVVRVGTFNVRTAKATGDSRTWLRRATDVAREISSHNPGVVALQELGPGRADGKNGTTTGTIRQTVSLQKALNGVGAGRYHLVRTTPYVKAGSKHGTQGARILYDTSKFRLLSNCPDTTGKSSYSTSCSVELPLRGGDSQGLRRSAAFAEFQNKSTGKRFFFASMHLDDRHSGNLNTEKKYNALRGAQAAAVYSRISHLNTRGEQVIVAGRPELLAEQPRWERPARLLRRQGLLRHRSRAVQGQHPVLDDQPLRQDDLTRRTGLRRADRRHHGEGQPGSTSLRERDEAGRQQSPLRPQPGGERSGPLGPIARPQRGRWPQPTDPPPPSDLDQLSSMSARQGDDTERMDPLVRALCVALAVWGDDPPTPPDGYPSLALVKPGSRVTGGAGGGARGAVVHVSNQKRRNDEPCDQIAYVSTRSAETTPRPNR